MRGLPERFRTVDREFDRSIARLKEDASAITVLFSGGVDSSVLADGLRGHADLELLTVGTTSSVDLRQGEAAARLLELPWRGAVVGLAEVQDVIAAGGDDLNGTTGTVRSVAVSFAVAVAQSRPSRLLTAQGVDELFLGYAHFRGLAGAELEARYRADLASLTEREWPRAVRIGARLHREIFTPFLEPALRATCEAIPLAERAAGAEAKPWLRAWAEARGLPAEIVHRPKKALQYGSGIDRLLRAHSR